MKKDESELENINIYDSGGNNVKTRPNTRRSFWVKCKALLKDYCNHSTIAGLNFFTQNDLSILEWTWWILVFILCIGGCIYMILEIYIYKWSESPVVVSFATKETPIFQIPFPAVTICPETKIRMECLNYTDVKQKKIKGLPVDDLMTERFNHMSLLCDTANEDSKLFSDEKFTNESLFEFLHECSSINLDDHFFCIWLSEDLKCVDFFTPIITEVGICYSFNIFDRSELLKDDVIPFRDYMSRTESDFSIDEGYRIKDKLESYPLRAFFSGATNALNVIMISNKPDIIYSCESLSFQGFRASLHIPSRLPRPSENFLNIPLGQRVVVGLDPTMITTSSTVKGYRPELRDCYFENEKDLSFYKLYSQNSCNMECLANFTLDFCKCIPFYSPRKKGMEICGLGSNECLKDATGNYSLTLLQSKLSGENGFGTMCGCLPLCNDITYKYDLSQSVLNWHQEIKTNKLEDYIDPYNSDVSILTIFFKNNHFIPIERSELYGISDFISNFGGLLGLFTGFSLFSVAEIIYYLSVRIVENRRRYGDWAGPIEEAEN